MLPCYIGVFLANLNGIRSLYDGSWLYRTQIKPVADLPRNALAGLERIKRVLKTIQGLEAFEPAITCGIENQGLCSLYGRKNTAMIVFSPAALKELAPTVSFLKETYISAWSALVDSLSDDIQTLKGEINAFDQGQAAAAMGLYEEAQFCLDDDELYFVLKHEIYGHLFNADNEVRLAIKVVAALASLVFFAIIFSPKAYVESLVFFLLANLIAEISVQKMSFAQEIAADTKAMCADVRAKKGARTLLKKMCINELAAKRFFNLTGQVISPPDWLRQEFNHRFAIGHPAAKVRYAAVESEK